MFIVQVIYLLPQRELRGNSLENGARVAQKVFIPLLSKLWCLRDLADRVGVSYSYMSMVARGHSNMRVKVQARMGSALEAPAKVAPAQPACIDREAVWDRMNAHGFSQNEVARRAGISSSNLSQIMNGRNNLSPDVLKRLHGVLFQPTKAERWRRASGFRRRPLTTTKRRTTQMNLGGFIDTFKDAIARRVVESYPPLYRPSENGLRSPGCSASPWERRPTPSGARPSPSKPTGAPPSSARWAPARPSVRRVTRHRIPGSVGKNSEKVLGPTDPPRSKSLGGKQHVGKAATVPKRCRTGSARPARYGESLIA